MTRGARTALLVAVAVVVFGGALLASRGGSGSGSDQVVSGAQGSVTSPKPTVSAGGAAAAKSNGCPTTAANDPAYKVTVSPLKADSKDVTVDVARNGAPVTGATVCIEAAMSAMAHGGISGKAKEMPGGRYQFSDMGVGMQGSWEGTVYIGEPGRPVATVPVSFDVP